MDFFSMLQYRYKNSRNLNLCNWAGQCSPWALPAGLNDGKYLQCWGIHGILCIDMKLQIKRNEIWITKQKWNDHENWIFMAMLEGSLVEKGTWESNRQSLWIFIQSCTAGIEEGLRRKSSVPPRWRRSYKLIQNQIWFKKAIFIQYLKDNKFGQWSKMWCNLLSWADKNLEQL